MTAETTIRSLAVASVIALLLGPTPARAQDEPTDPPSDAPVCDERATSADLKQATDELVRGWVDLDVDSFMGASDEIRALIPCMDDEVIRPVAAELHRYEGLRSYMEKDPAAAARYFAAARTVDPDYVFPQTMVPEGSPVLEIWNAIEAGQSQTEPVPLPAEGRVQIDGNTTAERGVEQPAVFQLFGEDGAIRTTAYLEAREPLPAYELAPTHPRRSPPLLIIGGAALLGAAATGVMAGLSKKRFYDNSTPYEQLEPLQKRASSMSAATIALGTVGTGLGATAVILGDF